MTDGLKIQADLSRLEEDGRKELYAAVDEVQLQAVRIKYLGRKGLLTQLLREMGKLPADQRPAVGQRANEIKAGLEEAAEKALEKGRSRQKVESLSKDRVDFTLPGRKPPLGGKHLITQVTEEIEAIFEHLGLRSPRGRRRNWITTTLRPSIFPRTIRPGHAGHFLFFPQHGPAHAHLPRSGPGHGEPKTSPESHCSGEGVPARFRPHPQPHVPPGRRLRRRPPGYLCRPERNVGILRPPVVRPRCADALPSQLFFPSPSRAPRWISSALSAGGKGARSAKEAGGWKFWGRE